MADEDSGCFISSSVLESKVNNGFVVDLLIFPTRIVPFAFEKDSREVAIHKARVMPKNQLTNNLLDCLAAELAI
jgi:hypothetical protein